MLRTHAGLLLIMNTLTFVSEQGRGGKAVHGCMYQGWEMYQTTGPLVPENVLGSQKIFQIPVAL